MQEKVGRRQEGWSLLIEYSSSEERKFQRPTIQFWRSCIIISSSSSSSLSFLAAWFFLPSPSSFLPLVESFGDNWAAFIKITTVGLTRPLIIAAGIVNKVGAKRIVTRGDTRVQEQRCLIIDDTIDSRRLQPRSYVRPHIRAHVIHVVHEIISAGRWSDGQAIENCARGFLFAVRFRDREIFFFSALPPYSGKYYFDYMGIGEPASMASASRQLCCGPMLAHSISASNKFPSRPHVILL